MPLSLRLARSTVLMLGIKQNPWTEHGLPWLIFPWFSLELHGRKLLKIRSVHLPSILSPIHPPILLDMTCPERTQLNKAQMKYKHKYYISGNEMLTFANWKCTGNIITNAPELFCCAYMSWLSQFWL